jgi:hypothetical protein
VRRLRLTGIGDGLRLLARRRRGTENHGLPASIRQARAPFVRGTRLFTLTNHGGSPLRGRTQYLRTQTDRLGFLAPLAGYLRFSLVEFDGRADSVTRVASAVAPGHNASSV